MPADALVSPKDGTCVYLIMPRSDTACFQVFLTALSRKFARQDILLVLDGAPNHRCSDLALPGNISLLFLPPYSPELNPKENLWDEIREKIFKNSALKSIDAVRARRIEIMPRFWFSTPRLFNGHVRPGISFSGRIRSRYSRCTTISCASIRRCRQLRPGVTGG